MDWRQKVVVVTGATSGIGWAAVKQFAAAGARVALLGHNPDRLNAARKELGETPGELLTAVADLASATQTEQAFREILDRWKTIDVLCANAGSNGVWAPLDKLAAEEWDKTLATNLSGTFYSIKYALPGLKRRGGSVIVTSSVNGTRMFSNSGATAYAVSKAGQTALAKMLALELAEYNIRVNVICPGAIETPIHDKTVQRNLNEVQAPVEFPEGKIPLTRGKPGQPEQVADLIFFLAGDKASHITGAEIFIDGAQSLLQG